MYDARNLVNIADYPIHIDGEKRDAVLKRSAKVLLLMVAPFSKTF